MEEITGIPDTLESFLRSILVLKEVDLYCAKRASQEGKLPSGWNIQEANVHQWRRLPMPDASYYINCDVNKEATFEHFKSLALKVIDDTDIYSSQGMISLLFFANTIGFVHDEQVYMFVKEIADRLPIDRYAEVCRGLIGVFNKEYHFSSRTLKKDQGFVMYEELFRSLQYVDRMDSPIRLLISLLRWRTSELPFIELVNEMKPEPRVSVFEFKYDISFDDESFLRFLEQRPEEATFWGALITQPNSNLPDRYSKKVYNFFVADQWLEIGNHLFRHIYYQKGLARIKNEVKDILKNCFNDFLSPYFFIDDKTNIIINRVSDFVPELSALSGWLYEQSGSTGTILINDSSIEGFCNALTSHLSIINSNLKDYVSGQKDIYRIWFRDSYEPVAQITTLLLNVSIVSVNEDHWNKFRKAFESLCYKVRTLYYGTYASKNIAKRISNHLVALLLSFPDVDLKYQGNMPRINDCWLIFFNTLAIHWITLSEREKILWDADNYKDELQDMEMSYILKRLRNVPEPHQKSVDVLKSAIKHFATVNWRL